MSKFRVVLDAGHYPNYNKGAVDGYYEGTQMYYLTVYEKEEFENYENVEVLLTRNKISDSPSLSARGKLAKNANLFISNHSNAPAPNAKGYSSIRGVSVLDSVTKPNKSIAETIGKVVADAMGNNFRSVVYRRGNNGDYYGVLRHSIASGSKCSLLIEHGFHTNPEDCAFLLNHDNLKKLAKAKVENIAKIYGLKKKNNKDKDNYYRVRLSWDNSKSQLGAYESLDGAKTVADENQGFKVFDWNGKLIYTGKNIRPEPEVSYHTVEKGDTLWGIAHEYSMTVDELKKLNGLTSNIIHVGDKLRLNSNVKVEVKPVEKKVEKPKARSKVEIIKDLQKSLNDSGFRDSKSRKLVVDGIYGGNSKYVVKNNNIRKGSKNHFVGWLQRRLNELGYSLVVDNSFGGATERAFKDFQRKKGIKVDGICGSGSVDKLING